MVSFNKTFVGKDFQVKTRENTIIAANNPVISAVPWAVGLRFKM